MIQVDEREYMQSWKKHLDDFALLISQSGITLYEIAKGARVKYDTLLRALRRNAIRPENEDRIRYYINKRNNGNQENQTDRP